MTPLQDRPLAIGEAVDKASDQPSLPSHRTLGNVSLLEMTQPCGTLRDNPPPQITLVSARASGVRIRCDFSAGRFHRTVERDDLFLAAVGGVSEVQIDSAHDIRAVVIPLSVIQSLHPDPGSTSTLPDFASLHAGAFKSVEVQRMLNLLFEGSAQVNLITRLRTESAVLAILAELLHLAEKREPSGRDTMPKWKVQRVSEYINEHLDRDISLAELARLVDLSSSHLCRAFKAATGVPPAQFQLRERLRRAENLLATTNLPISEIAPMVGYASTQGLARSFLSNRGVTPSQFRRVAKR